MLGVTPALGRTFRPDETETAVGPPVTVIGYGAWQARFGGNKDIVGQTVKLNGQPFAIIGVAAKGFGGCGRQAAHEFWVPTSALRPPRSGRCGGAPHAGQGLLDVPGTP